MSTFIGHAKSTFWIGLLLTIAACSAADDAKQANCDTLVTETRATCMDMIRRGLDVSCNKYLIAIDTAMGQASGSLFDIGDDNESTVHSFCSIYVGKLREDRNEHADSMQAKGQTAPECTALADRFDTSCMANLGKEPLPGKCTNVARTFAISSASSRLPGGQMCSLAGMQLPKE